MLECSYGRLLRLLPRIPLTFSRALSVTTCSFTHYDTLKLNRNATPKDIKNAYLKLSKEYHPDRNPNDPHSHDRFVKLQEAYQTLGNADAKRNYDATLGFGSGSKTKSGFNRPYGHPDYTQRDEWIRADQRRREQQFNDTFRKPEDYEEFRQRYGQPHKLTPEEMAQFYRMKGFGKRGRELYVTVGAIALFILILEMYIARKKAKYYEYYSPFDDPMVTGRYPRSFELEYQAQKLVNDEKYRDYLNREIEKGNVGSAENEDRMSSET